MDKGYEVQKGGRHGPLVVYHCPECGHQIESLLSDAGSRDNCPACGNAVTIPGETEPPPIEQPEAPRQEPNGQFTVGWTFYEAVNAAAAKAALAEAGIPCVLQYAERKLGGSLFATPFWGRILVREQDAERADGIIDEILRARPPGEDENGSEGDEAEPKQENETTS